MSRPPNYVYSQRSAESVANLLTANYELRTPLRCTFYVLGLHDNYLIECGGKKYIFRIYRNDWRSPEEALFELELLAYLNDRGAPVAAPALSITGALALRIESPEGERMAALFAYAEGDAPADAITVDESMMLGHAVAEVHGLAEKFEPTHTRPALDMPYLLDESIAAIEPFIDHVGFAFLGDLQKALHALLPGLKKEAGVYGICTGDINPRNFHISHTNRITLFDFDQCGYGFRAFEIAKFASSLHAHKLKHALVRAFMDGYQRVRCISEAERSVIPYFEVVAAIWVMAIHARNANRIGHKFLDKPFWDKKLSALKELHGQQHLQRARV